MDKKTDKHLNYFKLVEAFNETDCPICRRNDEISYNYVDNLLYENVNDGAVREQLGDSLGFCKEHWQLFLKIGDSLGTAIIYNDLLAKFMNLLVSGNFNKFLNRKTCPVCNLIEEQTRNNLKIFLSYYNDSEFRKEFEQTNGLCANHLIRLLRASEKKEQKDYFIYFHKKKIEQIQNKLNELIRKNDYRFESEKISAEEGESWIKAIKFLNDYK